MQGTEPFSCIDFSEREFFIRHGISGTRKDEAARHIRKSFFPGDQDCEHANERFAVLATLASHCGDMVPRRPSARPRLEAGTIIRDDAGQILLCLQPRCDSVRLRGSRRFVFALLLDSEDAFDFLLPIGDRLKRVGIPKADGRHVMSIAFSPGKGCEVVVAAEDSHGAMAFADVEGRRYDWIATLRDTTAFGTVAEVLSPLARIGLNQLEWLRRSGS